MSASVAGWDKADRQTEAGRCSKGKGLSAAADAAAATAGPTTTTRRARRKPHVRAVQRAGEKEGGGDVAENSKQTQPRGPGANFNDFARISQVASEYLWGVSAF